MANYAMLKYSCMIRDIQAVRDRFEARAFGNRREVEDQALALWKRGEKNAAGQLLTEHADKNAADVLREWWKLSEQLYLKYNDGYLNTTAGIAQAVFYPAWWLKLVGYEDGPTSYGKPAAAKKSLELRPANDTIALFCLLRSRSAETTGYRMENPKSGDTFPVDSH